MYFSSFYDKYISYLPDWFVIIVCIILIIYFLYTLFKIIKRCIFHASD